MRRYKFVSSEYSHHGHRYILKFWIPRPAQQASDCWFRYSRSTTWSVCQRELKTAPRWKSRFTHGGSLTLDSLIICNGWNSENIMWRDMNEHFGWNVKKEYTIHNLGRNTHSGENWAEKLLERLKGRKTVRSAIKKQQPGKTMKKMSWIKPNKKKMRETMIGNSKGSVAEPQILKSIVVIRGE